MKMTRSRLLALVTMLLALQLALQPVQAATETIYYIDAEAGKLYAVNTGGVPYRAFYIDESGQVVYVTTYRWTANPSYIIFEAPCNCRIYLRAEPTVALAEYSTLGLFDDLLGTSYTLGPRAQTLAVMAAAAGESWALATVNVSVGDPWTAVALAGEEYVDRLCVSLLVESAPTTITFTTTQPVAKWQTGVNTVSYVYIANSGWVVKSFSSNVYVYDGSTVRSGEIYAVIDGVDKFVKPYTVITAGRAALRQYIVGDAYGEPWWTEVSLGVAAVDTVSVCFGPDELASRGLVVIDTLAGLGTETLLVSSSEGSFFLYSAPLSITFNEAVDLRGVLLIPYNGSLERPAIYLPELGMWLPAAHVDGLLIAPMPSLGNISSLNAELVSNYPYVYTLAVPQVERLENPADLAAVVPIANGTIYPEFGNATLLFPPGAALIWHGTFNVTGSSGVEIHSITVGNESYVLVYATSTSRITVYFSGDGWLIKNARPLLADYDVSLGDFALKEYPINTIDVALSGTITGSWAYRIPVYITLSYLPQSLTDTGYLFRLELPIGDWIRAGLLSPALEDLLIVDSSMQPLPFAIIKNDGERAVVYVRYTRPLLSQSIVIYILLKNEQLWGTGNSFASLTATFDRINPVEGVDDLGWSYSYTYLVYNVWLFVGGNTTVAAGPTTFDFVAWQPSGGEIWEQHGSLVTRNITVDAASGDEVLVLFSNNFNDALVYVDGRPWYSIPLAQFNQTSPAYYVKWKGAGAVYAGKMIPYSYAIGQLTGSMEVPAKVEVQQPVPQTQSSGASMWDLLAAMAPLFLMAIIIRLIQNPPAPQPYPR